MRVKTVITYRILMLNSPLANPSVRLPKSNCLVITSGCQYYLIALTGHSKSLMRQKHEQEKLFSTEDMFIMCRYMPTPFRVRGYLIHFRMKKIVISK